MTRAKLCPICGVRPRPKPGSWRDPCHRDSVVRLLGFATTTQIAEWAAARARAAAKRGTP